MPTPRRSLTALAAATAMALAAAAPAAADSISYVKDGNVWLTTPDGARQFQVTSSGAYTYASQADDGTFVALTGERLHRLDRMGNVLADFATPVSDGPPPPSPPGYSDATANYFHGPFDPEISPDGTKVTYTYYWQHYTYDHILGGMRQRLESGTAISHADRLTGWDEFGGNLSGWVDATWLDNGLIARANAGVPLAEDVVLNTVAPGQKSELTRWYRSPGGYKRQDPEINDQRTMLALAGTAAEPVKEHMAVWRITDGFSADPEPCFAIIDDKQRDRIPNGLSWSPDGLSLAWEDSQGINTYLVGDQSAGCKPAEGETKLLIPGGTDPDWGPADVPAGRPSAPAKPAPAPGGKPTGQSPVAGKPVAGAAPVKLAEALASGLKVTVKAPAKGSVRVTARKGAKVVARGTATAKRKGAAVAVTLRFTAAGKRALAGGAGAVRLKLTATAAGRKKVSSVTVER
jgi:hypothetical protein